MVERNELIAAPTTARSRHGRPAISERIETGLVLRAVGYVGKPLPGVPFDDRRATVLNEGGRVLDPEHAAADPRPVRRRLDQARALRRDRHQQEVRAGDNRVPARGLCRRPAARADATRRRRCWSACVTRASTSSTTPAGKRSTRMSARSASPAGRPRVKLVRRDEQLRRAAGGVSRDAAQRAQSAGISRAPRAAAGVHHRRRGREHVLRAAAAAHARPRVRRRHRHHRPAGDDRPDRLRDRASPSWCRSAIWSSGAG